MDNKEEKHKNVEWKNRYGVSGVKLHVIACSDLTNKNDVERLQSLLASISKPSGSGSLAITGLDLGTDDWNC
ncbi:hypothetical protein P8452_44040 [Trifolium repens]|nr:hypothetical protein P8452_44040 [Trifolium repens]